MGVKISRVRDKRTLKRITTLDCEKGYKGEYICDSENCLAEMSFVAKHEKRRYEKVFEVSSFFKLKEGYTHSSLCPFDTSGILKIIAKKSDSNVLEALNDGKFEFSLQILHQPKQTNLGEKNNGKNLNDSEAQIKKKQKEYISNGKMSNYINILNQILILRSQLEFNENISSQLRLKYQGKKIKWDNFYFADDQYQDLFILGMSEKISYPICLEGVVSKIDTPTEKFKYYSIKLSSPYVELIEKVTEIPSVQLLMSKEIYEEIKIEKEESILVYGLAKFKKADKTWKANEENEIQFLNITIWINYKQQMIKLDNI